MIRKDGARTSTLATGAGFKSPPLAISFAEPNVVSLAVLYVVSFADPTPVTLAVPDMVSLAGPGAVSFAVLTAVL